MLQSLPALRAVAISARGLYSLQLTQQLGRGLATESHDDFKPQSKVQTGDANSQIEQWVKSNRVFIFMKGVPSAPQCGFSNMACQVLNHHGVQFGSANVLADNAVREGIKKFTGWPTIPQVFVDSEFIGGADILLKMHESGELDKLLEPVRQAQAKQ